MISLENKTNVQAPGGDYSSYGTIKDDSGANDGTPVNVEVYGDLHQLLQRMATEADITINDLPDNDTNGFQLYEALLKTFVHQYGSAIALSGGGITLPITTGNAFEITGTGVLQKMTTRPNGSIVLLTKTDSGELYIGASVSGGSGFSNVQSDDNGANGIRLVQNDTVVLMHVNDEWQVVARPSRRTRHWTAMLTQGGTSDPTANVIANDMVGTISLSRYAVGRYSIDSTSPEFIENLTWVMVSGVGNGATAVAYWNDTDQIYIDTYNSAGSLADGILSDTAIEIRAKQS